MTKRYLRRWSMAEGLASVLLVSHGVAACAAPTPSANPPGPGFGPMGRQSADQHFIVMLIPHHDGAIAMAELALSRAKRPQIKALAQQIKASQTAEHARCVAGTASGTAPMCRHGLPVAWARV